MNAMGTERQVKLELVAAVAQSQRAIARMLDSLADLSHMSPLDSRAAAENIRLLTNLQQSLTEAVVGTRLCERRSGQPGRPWLADGLNQPSMLANGRTGRESE